VAGLEKGARLGNYRLDDLLGRGGMGSVWRATHHRLGRTAAIKILAPELAADEQYVSRFFHEARIVNEVRHPNIVDVYDFLELEEPKCVAYVMELLEGASLGSLLKQRALAPIQAIHAAIQIAGALEAVHKVGVVHRDLKPDNVIVIGRLDGDLSEVPSLKVLDFGIAKVSDPERAHKTGTGYLLGTPAYMAPEQVGGEMVNAAADAYALGEILFEMLAGRRVWTADVGAIFRAKVSGQSPDLTLPEETPASFAFLDLTRKLLDPLPEKRPTMPEVIAALRAIAPTVALTPGAPVPIPPSTGAAERVDTSPSLLQASVVLPPPEDTTRASKVVALGAGGVFVLGAILGGVAWWMRANADLAAVPVMVAPSSPDAAAGVAPVEPTVAPDAAVAAPPAPPKVERVKERRPARVDRRKAKESKPDPEAPRPIDKKETPKW
jgi:serine/threonine-protein kinase